MEADSKQLTIITFRGQQYKLDYIPIMTVGELKYNLLQLDSSVPDFDFMYAGRMVRSSDKVLS